MGWLLLTTLLGSSLDRALILRVLRSGAPGFERCYEAQLRREPLEGRVVFDLEVAADGRVHAVTLELPRPAPDFAHCLRSRAQRLRFPAGVDRFKVRWPVTFRRRPAAAGPE